MADRTGSNLEGRLRDHLARVASLPPRSGLEQRVIARTDQPRHATWRATLAVVAVVVVAVMMLLLLTVGHQSTTIFSNVSNGLSS